MGHPQHVAIAGGGIIGLACALVLRCRGFDVIVLEAGKAGGEASWAAGGMLAAEDPENPPALLLFSRYSRELYPGFLDEIEAFSGRRVPLRTRETVQILHQNGRVPRGKPLSCEEAFELVPGLTNTADRYVLLQEPSVDPREVCEALRLAVLAAGVDLREQQRVLSAEAEGSGVLVTTSSRSLRADKFVNCCGAWAAALHPPVRVVPSKGQMRVIAQPKDRLLTRVLRSPDVYLIPRGDDRIVIGATVENAGYSKQVEPGALALLGERAGAIWEPAANALQIDSWAGLRPRTADALPVIGPYEEGDSQRLLATGHFRNGILLAPGTAHVIADLICGIEPAIDLAPFTPLRSSISTECDKHFAAAL
jgi:glycine oxidase